MLIGCESLHCDGSVVNSLGSKPLARIARALEVPVYCCAELFKLDLRLLCRRHRTVGGPVL